MSRETNSQNTKEAQKVPGVVHGTGKCAVKIVKRDGSSLGLGAGEVIEVNPLHSATGGLTGSKASQSTTTWSSPSVSDVSPEVNSKKVERFTWFQI